MVVRAVLVTPLSGPLARYGQAGAAALRLWAEWQGNAEIDVVDAHPDPARAAADATRMAPDLLFGPYGSGPARAVVAATSRLIWNHGGAQVGSAPNVVNVLAPADTYFVGAVRAVHRANPAARRVCLLHTGSGFSRAVGDGAAQAAQRLGFTVTDVSFDADPPAAELLLVAGGFAEELEAARRLLPGRWDAAAFIGAGVEEVLAALGARREGLLGPAQWLLSAAPDPDEGPDAEDFVAAHRRLTGADPSYPAVQAFAAGLVAARCLRAAGNSGDAALLDAARTLDCTTLFGRFRLDPTGRQVGHEVLTVQWQEGARRVVWPPGRAEAGLRYPMRPSPSSRGAAEASEQPP